MYIRLITSECLAVCPSQCTKQTRMAEYGDLRVCMVYTNVVVHFTTAPQSFLYLPEAMSRLVCVPTPNKFAESERIQISIFIEF